MYKSRWAIESFFRWIKLNLNVPVLFGTTSNALFNQLFTAIIAYALLKFLRAQGQKTKQTLVICRFHTPVSL
ncbi:transposase [Peribacillus butanolivorans]|uniref:transposase n=1 Tax=Peribacillus butanolivorans TaxID=421767 RepID=UPI003636C69B